MNPDRRRVFMHSAAVAALGLTEFGFGVSAATQAQIGDLDVHIELRARQDRVVIRSGDETAVWRYEGRLLRGDPGSLQPSAGEDYAGLFLYHCHMLEHEDSGLMRNYLVKA